jgi:hypothetical protein
VGFILWVRDKPEPRQALLLKEEWYWDRGPSSRTCEEIKLKGYVYPAAEVDAMRRALDQHARHIGERLTPEVRVGELNHILQALQELPSNSAAEGLSSILLECIRRREGDPMFRDDVASMRAAVGGFMLKRASATKH